MLGKRIVDNDQSSPPARKRQKKCLDDPQTWTVAEIKEWLKTKKLPVSGNKSAIVDRVLKEMKKSEKVEDKIKQKKSRKHILIETEYPPKNWDEMYQTIKNQRKSIIAPIDEIGVMTTPNKLAAAKEKRYQILVSHMLSGQTRDTVTAATMEKLKTFGLTTKKISDISLEDLKEIIKPVRFSARKAQ